MVQDGGCPNDVDGAHLSPELPVVHRASHALARSPASASHASLHDFLHYRESNGRRPPRRGAAPRVDSAIAARFPHCLRERELDGVAKCDKIFASAWLDTERVLAGTKDNQVAQPL